MPTLISFIAATAAVAIVTWIWVRRLDRSENATEEYFTGGRALAWRNGVCGGLRHRSSLIRCIKFGVNFAEPGAGSDVQ